MRPIDGERLENIVQTELEETLHNKEFARVCHHAEYKHFLMLIRSMPTIAPPPNDPLTLEELREMAGEPIYITGMGWEICYGLDESPANPAIIIGLTTRLYLNGYGETWFAYRRKPEGGG